MEKQRKHGNFCKLKKSMTYNDMMIWMNIVLNQQIQKNVSEPSYIKHEALQNHESNGGNSHGMNHNEPTYSVLVKDPT
jgi:hypothetical protein